MKLAHFRDGMTSVSVCCNFRTYLIGVSKLKRISILKIVDSLQCIVFVQIYFLQLKIGSKEYNKDANRLPIEVYLRKSIHP